MNPSKPSSRIKSALQSKRISELCKGQTCQVCRIIQSNFDTENRLKNEIQLSTNSKEFGESTITITRRNKIKRAVIVCRTIAGSMVNMTDKETEEYDSTGSQNLDPTSEYLTERKPCAVLPRFVIVFT
ncbi:PREDICTED: nucleic acid binding [Prunus dulcis]|uniref:PREDICTED: nucleic acid binding n=1 Tax=Prunus dulcis TaxID=3755 RepID=A0A5E4GCP2_PRUDU|nr:PREDICTED: nucleic acid binding [Prunus dulcis]